MDAAHVQNVVQYDLYTDEDFDDKDENEIKNDLLETRHVVLSHISSILVDYIWQRDSFDLIPITGTSADCPPHLHGATDFGDNIDDEWFIVYLLYQLSTVIPGLIATIHDGDGEFLLIEAAYHLPKWLEPESSTNRVFLFEGDLHIIPKPRSPAELAMFPAGVPSRSHAIRTVRCHPESTLASKHIREAVKARTREFPEKLKANFHHANCLVPAKLAAVLKQQPGLVAPAVEAFYQRDPLDLRGCRVMKNFAPEKLVKTRVRFTRCLYAQLAQQQFTPDRRSGWKLPSPSGPEFSPADLGMKLAHGFEMLCGRCGGEKRKAGLIDSKSHDLDGIASGPRWNEFLESLTDKGFFKGELQGSKLYRELLQSAKRFYADTMVGCASSENTSWSIPGERILSLLETMSCDVEELRKEEKKLPPSDSESWMELTVEDLDAMIAKAAGKASGPGMEPPSQKRGQGGEAMHANFDPSQVTDSLKSFVEAVSGLEGAEFPGEVGPVGDVQFNAEEFERAMRNILEFKGPAAEDSDSDSDLMREKDYQSGGDSSEDEDGDEDGGADGNHDDENIRELMEQMDRELSTSEIGSSFEKQAVPQPLPKEQAAIDQSNSTRHSESTGQNHLNTGDDECEEGEDDSYRPVEVDVNLLKNILESYNSQQGLAGPASNILHSMGVHIPVNEDDVDIDNDDGNDR